MSMGFGFAGVPVYVTFPSIVAEPGAATVIAAMESSITAAKEIRWMDMPFFSPPVALALKIGCDSLPS